MKRFPSPRPASGFGRQKEHSEVYRGPENTVADRFNRSTIEVELPR